MNVSGKILPTKKAQKRKEKLLWLFNFLLSLSLTFLFIYILFDLSPRGIWTLIKSLGGEKGGSSSSSGSFPGRGRRLDDNHHSSCNFFQVTATEVSKVRKKARHSRLGKLFFPLTPLRDLDNWTSPEDKKALSFWILFDIVFAFGIIYLVTYYLVRWLTRKIFFEKESEEESF